MELRSAYAHNEYISRRAARQSPPVDKAPPIITRPKRSTATAATATATAVA